MIILKFFFLNIKCLYYWEEKEELYKYEGWLSVILVFVVLKLMVYVLMGFCVMLFLWERKGCLNGFF